MSAEFEYNKTVLQKILPRGYDYNVIGVSLREDGESSTEVKLDAKFRVNIHNEEQFEKFLVDFSKSSGTAYNKKNRADRAGKKTVLSGYRKCIHNVQNLKKNENASKETNKNDNKTGMIREPGKNTD